MSSHCALRSVVLVAACAVLSACGGGGGGGSSSAGTTSPPNDVSMTESPASLTVTARQSDPAPTAQFTLFFATTATGSVQISLSDQFTQNGITGISAAAGTTSANTGTLVVQFKSPATLPPGTYTDTVTIKACYQSPCVDQVLGSPVTVTTTYTVVGVAPTLTAISPTSTAAGVPGFTLTVTGSPFTALSVVLWNGQPLPTTVVSATELRATVPATDLASAATVPITVVDSSGGTPSAPIDFTIEPPAAPSLTAVAPATLAAGSPGAMLDVTGSGFNTTSTVQWNGVALATTPRSTTELDAQVPAADLAAVGTAAVTVSNATAPAGTSAATSVAIVDQSLDAVAFQITPAHAGVMQFANFTLPTAIQWQTTLDGLPSYPVIADGKVFFTVELIGDAGELVALDQATGAIAWGPVPLGARGSATYDSGTVFVLSESSALAGVVQAFDAATGVQRWSVSLTSQPYFDGTPVAANGIVYVVGTGNGSTLFAISEATGAILWTAPSTAGTALATPAVTSSGVYLQFGCSTVDEDPSTGAQIWSTPGTCAAIPEIVPSVANGVVYSPDAPSGYGGTTLNAQTGVTLGSYQADTAPAIAATEGYFLQAGTLQAVDLASNTIAWRFTGDGSLMGAPIVVDGDVFISGSTGVLYALDGATGAVRWTTTLPNAADSGNGWDTGLPFGGIGAGDGLLVVPAGNTVTAYTLSTNP